MHLFRDFNIFININRLIFSNQIILFSITTVDDRFGHLFGLFFMYGIYNSIQFGSVEDKSTTSIDF